MAGCAGNAGPAPGGAGLAYSPTTSSKAGSIRYTQARPSAMALPGAVELQQADVGDTGRQQHVRRVAGHSAAGDAVLHDVQRPQQHFRHAGAFVVTLPPGPIEQAGPQPQRRPVRSAPVGGKRRCPLRRRLRPPPRRLNASDGGLQAGQGTAARWVRCEWSRQVGWGIASISSAMCRRDLRAACTPPFLHCRPGDFIAPCTR